MTSLFLLVLVLGGHQSFRKAPIYLCRLLLGLGWTPCVIFSVFFLSSVIAGVGRFVINSMIFLTRSLLFLCRFSLFVGPNGDLDLDLDLGQSRRNGHMVS